MMLMKIVANILIEMKVVKVFLIDWSTVRINRRHDALKSRLMLRNEFAIESDGKENVRTNWRVVEN